MQDEVKLTIIKNKGDKNMKSVLTAKAEKEYIKHGSGTCPFCKGDDVEGGFIEVLDNQAFQSMVCNDCRTEWDDVYTLSRIIRKVK